MRYGKPGVMPGFLFGADTATKAHKKNPHTQCLRAQNNLLN
jgi:hypothetical protein